MYKVVIIDDEPIIVEGISRLVPWGKYQCCVSACAYSGREGLEVIKREKPDIIFSDISMPGLDGLKMIAALKSEFPDMQISILTGYRDFDYCQEALRLGVTRFLLKPSTDQRGSSPAERDPGTGFCEDTCLAGTRKIAPVVSALRKNNKERAVKQSA